MNMLANFKRLASGLTKEVVKEKLKVLKAVRDETVKAAKEKKAKEDEKTETEIKEIVDSMISKVISRPEAAEETKEPRDIKTTGDTDRTSSRSELEYKLAYLRKECEKC